MKAIELTLGAAGARAQVMQNAAFRTGAGIALAVVATGLAGCINVNAPSEPIVIELNVNITQEVLYRLVGSAQDNIEENPEIF